MKMPGILESPIITTSTEKMDVTKAEKKLKKKKKSATCLDKSSSDQFTVAVEIGNKTSSTDSKLKIDIVSANSQGTDIKIKKKKKKKENNVTIATSTLELHATEEKVKKKKKKRTVDEVTTEENPAKKLKTENGATPVEKKKKKKKVKSESPAPVDIRDSPDLSSATPSPSSLSEDEEQEQEKPPVKSEDEELGNFSNFNISKVTCSKLESKGIKYLFPVQYKTIAKCMSGSDIIVKARTGSGKTLAFAIPLVERLQAAPNNTMGRPPRVLVLSPTRELAKQIGDDFGSISTTARSTCFYGGSAYGPQFGEIRRGIDVLVGTPGRILDHLTKTGPNVLSLSHLEYVVLDEVDRMLDMGFSEDVEKILTSAYDLENREEKKKPQTLLFSATVPSWVRNIANKYLEASNVVEVDLIGLQGNQTSTTVDHLAVRCVSSARPGIIDVLLRKYGGVAGRKEARAMVFCQTKAECAELSCSPLLSFPRQMLSGDVPQDQRERVMKEFRDGRCQCLVATDVAARGLDVPEVDMVIQCSPPGDVDSYIHRSGRTGRAGRRGVCICLYGPNEENKLKQVERAAKVSFTRTPAPKPEELMDLKKDEILESLDEISDEARDVFLDSADALIESKGAREALAIALAALSGIKTTQRSILTGAENSSTLMVTSRQGFRSKGFVYRILENRLGAEMKEKISSLSITANGDSAIFDIPTAEKDNMMTNFQSDHREWIEECSEIPALQEPPPKFGFRGGYGRGRGGGGGFGNRSFGGRGGNMGMTSAPNAPKRKISF